MVRLAATRNGVTIIVKSCCAKLHFCNYTIGLREKRERLMGDREFVTAPVTQTSSLTVLTRLYEDSDLSAYELHGDELNFSPAEARPLA
jgi:hypothetical protein